MKTRGEALQNNVIKNLNGFELRQLHAPWSRTKTIMKYFPAGSQNQHIHWQHNKTRVHVYYKTAEFTLVAKH